MNYIASVERKIANYKEALAHHKVYNILSEIDDIRIFMEKHVYAVWDFMSLLKALQHHLTGTTIPWKPVDNATTARFINEIVLGEETDVNEQGVPTSHFEMYLEAMQEVQADTSKIMEFISHFHTLSDLENALNKVSLKPAESSFLRYTFSAIASGEPHKIASAFTFGREDLIPDMFIEIINHADKKGASLFPKLRYYLERHIEVDGDEHGPLSIGMIQELCGDDERKWQEVAEVAKAALRERISLWDEIAEEIERNTAERSEAIL